MKKKKFTVWVGGGEVNENYIYSREEAEDIAQCWRDKGYDDVYVEEITFTPENVCLGRDDLLAVAEAIVAEWGEGDGEELVEVLAQSAIKYIKELKK